MALNSSLACLFFSFFSYFGNLPLLISGTSQETFASVCISNPLLYAVPLVLVSRMSTEVRCQLGHLKLTRNLGNAFSLVFVSRRRR